MSARVVALAGNPNTGKSTIFNALTGAQQHVGNWPGKTVEKKEGTWRYQGQEYRLVDLPGAYSLSAYSVEERIARDFISDERPQVVVIVVDAANLERNLYLVVQILEMEANAIVVLNMQDQALAQGLQIDGAGLAAALTVPVLFAAARRGEGLEQIKTQAARLTETGPIPGRQRAPVTFDPQIEQALDVLTAQITAIPELARRYPPRWLAIKLLEEDESCWRKLAHLPQAAGLWPQASELAAALRSALGEDVDTLIADRRYAWINALVRATVTRPAQPRASLSDRIDQIVTHRWLGGPLFLAAMWVVFKLTIDVSTPYLDWIDAAMNGPVARLTAYGLARIGWGGGWFERMLVDGVIAGVGGVLTFVPVLAFLYLALGVLEDSGYMARAAFVMDRVMRRLGLQGRSFLPLLLGFGCNVPAIYATRTLDSRRDRLLTGLLVPFMSCSARLPVYLLMAAIFFPAASSLVVFALYLFGILAALGVGFILARTAFRGQAASPLLLELPPYRLPTLATLRRYVWVRLSAFLSGAGTVILAASMAVWLLLALPTSAEQRFAQTPVAESAFARVAGVVTPLLRPLGFGSWENASALLSGFVAKEVVISTMIQVYGAPDGSAARPGPVEGIDPAAEARDLAGSFIQATVDTIKAAPLLVGIDLRAQADAATPPGLAAAVRAGFERSSGGHGALAALAFLLFILLYTPCMAVVAAERQEFGGRWAWVSIVGQLAVAWGAAFLLFQGGLWLGVG